MIRSILVVVDGSGSSLAGARLAFDLARLCGAYVEIRRPKTAPIGGLTSKTVPDLGLVEHADRPVREVLCSFRDDAGRAKVSFEAHKIDGDLLAQTGLEDVTSDVVVLGDQFLFGVDGELVAVRTCGDRITGCASPPVILVSDSAVAPVLVTFDEVRRFGNTAHAGAAPTGAAA